MSKYYGNVGYAVSSEVYTDDQKPTGIWEDTITVRAYYGDVLKESTKWQNGTASNDNLNVSHRISILADAFAYQNFSQIKYVEWLGNKWKVTDAEVQRPRLILSIGGVYNGE